MLSGYKTVWKNILRVLESSGIYVTDRQTDRQPLFDGKTALTHSVDVRLKTKIVVVVVVVEL